jgi:hypothetical protein
MFYPKKATKYVVKMKRIILLASVLFFLFSCEKDVYYYFTENEKAMFNYEEGDSILLLRQPQFDTTLFVITNKNIQSLRHSALGFEYTNYQICDIEFESSQKISCYIYAEKLKEFSMTISLNLEFSQEFEGQLRDTLNNYPFDGVQYGEVFVFSNGDGSPNLYYTKEKGIIYIENSNSLNSYTLIDK